MTKTTKNEKEDVNYDDDDTEDVSYDVPSLDFLDFKPRYPTIDPKTKCHDGTKWGNWILDRELSTRDIVDLQKKCMEKKKLDFNTSVNIESEEYGDVSDKSFTPNVLSDPKSNECELQLALEFPKLNHYCRNDDHDMSALNLHEMTKTFCDSGKYAMKCLNANDFKPRKINVSCSEDNKGMFFCTDGTISCTPCAFDRLDLERKLHQGFLKSFCDNNKHTGDCRSKGLNSETGKAYNRGFLHTGFQ